ncbi:MAG TPA: chemotaxis protein CheA [Allosphingosinicella sp.]|jgi:two-component system chemotaxis sensor kinase CheA|nr:chemotaxis protein CheA [Allosphingosinicella sp.]
MDDLINDFLAETREMLQALAGAIVAWEADPSDRARLDEIFRFVHTVKGNCGFFDLPRLRQLSHAAEDALAEARSGRRGADAKLVSAVLAVIDRIGELVQALETGEALASEDDELLIAALTGEAAPPALEPEPAAAPETKKAMRSIRLSVDLLDRMMSGVSDAVLARNELARRLRDAPRDVAVEAAFERVSACIADIRDAITRTRMQRIDNLFSALPRMVRDLAGELGKQVRLEVEGGDVELDREMIEMIRDPLTHIVRNAIDHGIEPAADRAQAGKEAAGRLKVCARQAGNQILIEISDDGRGIDGEALVRSAITAGLLNGERAERLSPAQKTALIFTPGLSTAGEVTAISGRGVGMDVVRANVERIGGLVDIDSRPGQGVRLCIRVPLTLTIIPALTVSAGGQLFAIPRAAIEEILRPAGQAVRIEAVGEAEVATVRGRRVPLVSLAALLGTADAGAVQDRKLILLKPAGGEVYALAVDAVHDHEELVVKPAAPPVMAAGLYAGTTLAEDGRPILLLDPSGMAEAAGFGEEEASDPEPAPEPTGDRAAPESMLLLFRDLAGRERAVPIAALERIEAVAPEAVAFTAGRLRVAIGERILPLAGCDAPPAGPARILRLTDGEAELAYAFAEVIDIRSLSFDLQPSPAEGEVAGVALIDGAQVELLDPYWLFATHADAAPAGEQVPVCAIPTGDPWMETILRPLIESLGYRVVAAAEGVAADILIASADAVDSPPVAAGEVLRIRSRRQCSGENDNSIYRYDRAGLLDALSRGAGKGRGHE